MKIGVLSDTHDNIGNLQAALDVLRREDINVVLHCGDLTSARLLSLFEGFELHLVQGNVDGASQVIAHAVRRLGNGSTYGLTYEADLDGVSVAVIHGDDDEARKTLQRSGLYAFVFHGHSHKRKDKMKGRTRVINPGALGGKQVESRSFCIVNLETGQVHFVEQAPHRRDAEGAEYE
jgi:putative phosphoesterase